MTAIIQRRKTFAVFDTETTGLTVHPSAQLGLQPRIIEFAGIITDGFEIIDTIEFICNPGIALEQIITDITGLKNEDLEDQPFFDNFIDEISVFFSQADAVVAHNLSFDRDMLSYDLKRAGCTIDRVNWPDIQLCTVEQTFHQYGRRMKLSELHELLLGPYVQKHRAMDDIGLLHNVCLKLGVYNAFL